MNKKRGLIILNILIVAAGLFIVYSFYNRLIQPGGDTVVNYALFIGFALFTYINLKKVIQMFKKPRE